MSGTAEVLFTCGATEEKQADSDYVYDAPCGATETAVLWSEYYLGFNAPDDWHIDLDLDPSIVRCPAHCRVVLNSQNCFDHWEDTP